MFQRMDPESYLCRRDSSVFSNAVLGQLGPLPIWALEMPWQVSGAFRSKVTPQCWAADSRDLSWGSYS